MSHPSTKAPTDPSEVAAPRQYLTVSLANEEYGIDILSVREIRGFTTATRIPQAPAYVLGVLNLRGAIVPVIDMRARFGVAPPADDALRVTVIITVDGRLFGAVVDAVSDVLDIDTDAIRTVPAMGTAVDTRYLKGLTTHKGRMVLLLDVNRLLQPDDAQQLAAVLPEVAEHLAIA